MTPDDPWGLWSPVGPLEGPTLQRGRADPLKQVRLGGSIGSHLREHHPQSSAEAETDNMGHNKLSLPRTQKGFTEGVPLPGLSPRTWESPR